MSFTASRLSSVVSAVLLALASSACAINLDAAKVTDREERRFTVSGKPEIVLTTFDGAVDIRAWNEPGVLVEVEKQAESLEAAKDIKVTYAQAGNRITIEIEKPKQFEGIGINTVSRSASVRISLPAEADVRAKSGDGAMTLSGVTGAIEVRSGDGAIKGKALGGNLVVHTGDGAVSFEDVNGRLDLSTGDGSVQVNGVLQRLQAKTGDGPITVRVAAGSATSDDWELTTGDGPMTMELPSGFAAEIDAHTGDGGISVEGLQIAGAQPTGERRDDLKGSLGTGGRALKLRTGDGPIRLKAAS